MSILVTGGAGYIGSHVCVELLAAGEDIVLLDNFSNAERTVADRISELSGRTFPVCDVDLLDREGLGRVFAGHDIESVIHLAGRKAVGESVSLPVLYYHNNITGTLHLCQAMAEAGCHSMVFSSSATVYGANPIVPFREDFALSATSPYGMTKVVIERILTDLAAAEPDWRFCLLRYFNPIGAHPSGLLGERPDGVPNNLLPYIAQVAAGQRTHLTVFGDDYPTRDGTGVRDYLHVVDLALGHLKALAYVRAHAGAEAVNLGTGTGYSVLEIVAAFERASGLKIPYIVAPRRAGDIAVMSADPAKAERLLGWKALRGLDDMCADAWRFASRAAEELN
ncbi:MAG: UDP-glucose 4-epimerase GalE [Oscillospiraceae bacterium]|jgi:UDP-glucose 4-epimerase|nr:UDP-glucose 4-epimerase GalE [Oscillospiraceae bacterium]